jgi:DNA-binding IscR family transcriptional regulator
MRMPLLPHKIILAIGAVVDIALSSGKEPVSALDLADRLQLPGRHLEPVLQTLVRKGILQGECAG